MRVATIGRLRRTSRSIVLAVGMAAILAIGMLPATGALAANSRVYSVFVSTPSPASAGASTTFTVSVSSGDNQTIANMVVIVDLTTGVDSYTATYNVYGPGGTGCSGTPGPTVTCDLGNLGAGETRYFSVVAKTTQTNTPAQVTFTALAETNNENGSNLQIVAASSSFTPGKYDPNNIQTFDLTGSSTSTAGLDTPGAGKMSTKLNLFNNNNGNGNSLSIADDVTTGTSEYAVCSQYKLTCQPVLTEFHVNSGAVVTPYLETIITGIPSTTNYNIKQAFVIHLKDGGSVDVVLYAKDYKTTGCAAHPKLVPCADFSQDSNGVVTIKLHTATNGKGMW